MHLPGEQAAAMCLAVFLLGCLYGVWRGRMALRESLLLRSKEPSPYKLGGDFVYVVREEDYNRTTRAALQWELSCKDQIKDETIYQKEIRAYGNLKVLSWHDINEDMLSRSRELMRWVQESGEPIGEMAVAWFAWECTQAAWNAVGLAANFYPIHLQKWDGSLRSPFCTVMEKRARETQERNIKLMGQIGGDAITPMSLAAALREDLEAAGITDEILTFPDPGAHKVPAKTPDATWDRASGQQTSGDPDLIAKLDGHHSPKADPAQEFDDRIKAFNERVERAEDDAVKRAVDREEHVRSGPTHYHVTEGGMELHDSKCRPMADAPSPPDARSRLPGGSLDPERRVRDRDPYLNRDPYGSSLLNEDVADSIANPTDYGLDLGKVRRANEPGSFAGAPRDMPDTTSGNWFVISWAGDFYGPFTESTQAEEKAKGSSLVAWSVGQCSPAEFLTLCSQGKGFDADRLPPGRWYMRWTNDFGIRLAGPYRTEQEAANCGQAMDLPAWQTSREDEGPGEFTMPGIYFFDKEGVQQTDMGPSGSPAKAVIQAAKKDDRACADEAEAPSQGNWYVVRSGEDFAKQITRREYIGPFGSREEAHAWRLGTGKWGNRDNPIHQFADLEAILSPDDIVTAVPAKGSP